MSASPTGAAPASRSRGRLLIRRLRARLGGGRQQGLGVQGSDGGVDLPPPMPACPTGWVTGPPDFIGIGVQRCGTTRWFDLIASHPEIARPVAAKELHYFDRFHTGGYGEAQRADYHRYFPRDGNRKVGEWTPLYMTAPWIAPMLADAAPQARLLVLLRDPVERYLSGLELDTRVAARRGAPLSRYAPLEAFLRGLYHLQLQRLLCHFERSQLLILQYERCTREPQAELRRTFDFLGLEDLEFLPDLERHPKRQPNKPALEEGTRKAYAEAYQNDVSALAESFPEVDLSLWPNFAHLDGPGAR